MVVVKPRAVGQNAVALHILSARAFIERGWRLDYYEGLLEPKSGQDPIAVEASP